MLFSLRFLTQLMLNVVETEPKTDTAIPQKSAALVTVNR